MTDHNDIQPAACTSASCAETVAPEKRTRTIAPRYSLLENKDSFVVTLEMPGVDKDTLSIETDRETLTVRGRRAESTDGLRPLIRERVVADYHREFSMDDTVNHEAISASIQDGVVTITIPKAADLVPRKVAIS